MRTVFRFFPASLRPRAIGVLLAIAPVPVPVAEAGLGFGEQIAVETFAGLREVERHQLKVAEKFYLRGEFLIALDEYDKFLTLYGRSAGAPYAQLMWSQCQRKLRKVNTAIRDGFQSVIDYWPESAEAVTAAFLIADSLRATGEVKKAETAYRNVIANHPDDVVAIRSKVALLEMARTAQEEEKRLAILGDLTFKTPRTEESEEACSRASRELASHHLHGGDLDESDRTLATTYQGDDERLFVLQELAGDAIRTLQANDQRRPALAIADRLVAALEARIPVDLDGGSARKLAKDVLGRIAAVHGQAGRAGEVLATIEREGKLLGFDDGVLGAMAAWFKAHGRRGEARRVYSRFEDQIEGQRQLVGMAREEGDWEAAIGGYRQLIGLDPGRSGEYLWGTAECYESNGQLKNAIRTYRDSDRFPESYFRMANCHRRLKEFDEALLLYRQIKSAGPSAAQADLETAFTLEEAGRKEQAVKAFQLTCKSHPRSGQASRAHAHLQDRYGISITLGGAKDE